MPVGEPGVLLDVGNLTGGAAAVNAGVALVAVEAPLLLAPSLQQWLPEGHLARFIADVTEQLDLSAIYSAYDRQDGQRASGLPSAAVDALAAVRLLRGRG
jgi:hypothetical protein